MYSKHVDTCMSAVCSIRAHTCWYEEKYVVVWGHMCGPCAHAKASLCLCLCLCLCLSLSLSLCHSVSPSVCLSVCLSVTVCLSVCLSACLSDYLSVILSVSLSLALSPPARYILGITNALAIRSATRLNMEARTSSSARDKSHALLEDYQTYGALSY